MATMNGVVAPATQAPPEPATTEEQAPAAAPSTPPEEGSLAAAGAPAPYRDRFFAVLQDLVTSSPMDSKSPRRLFGYRTNVMARLLTVDHRVEDGGNPALYQQAYLAARLWQARPSAGSTVRAVLDDIEFASSRNSPIYTVMYGMLASLLWLSLGAFVPLTLLSLVNVWASGSPSAVIDSYVNFLTSLASPISITAIFGMLGAVVSILLRLSEFENARRRSRQFLRMTGVVLPLVGVVFACVTHAVFDTGLINVSFGPEPGKMTNNIPFCIVIGFLSGFSERFTRGLLGSVEQSLVTTRSEAQTTLQTDDGATQSKVTQTTNVIKQEAPVA
jgi:hypothetical protein